MVLVSSEAVSTLFLACGVFAIAVWVGGAGNGWVPPKVILRAAALSISDSTLFKTIIVAFLLGMFYFAYSCDFDPALMINSLGLGRFSAPWSRGALGDSTAFIEQLYNFGYIVPSLTVLLAYRRGWLHPQAVIAAVLALIMIV